MENMIMNNISFKNFLREKDEEEWEEQHSFKNFVENILPKIEIEGEGEQLNIGVSNQDNKELRRILFDRKEFEKHAKQLIDLANDYGFYVFANDKKVAFAENKNLQKVTKLYPEKLGNH